MNVLSSFMSIHIEVMLDNNNNKKAYIIKHYIITLY